MKYWLDREGGAVSVHDHYEEAVEILARRGEIERSAKLTPDRYVEVYDAMFSLGYARIQTTNGRVYLDNERRPITQYQRRWLQRKEAEGYEIFVNNRNFESTRRGRQNAAVDIANRLLAG
jgi:hypothetical protein